MIENWGGKESVDTNTQMKKETVFNGSCVYFRAGQIRSRLQKDDMCSVEYVTDLKDAQFSAVTEMFDFVTLMQTGTDRRSCLTSVTIQDGLRMRQSREQTIL